MTNEQNNDQFADILQYAGQWFVMIGEIISLLGQGIALEQEAEEQIEEKQAQQRQMLHYSSVEQQLEQLQQQMVSLQQQLERMNKP